PGVSPFPREDRRDVLAESLTGEGLLTSLAVDGDHRNAPVLLAGEAPVGSRRDHVGDALATPFREPAHAIDLREPARAELRPVDADEPLLGGPEDDGVLAAPAVGVAVCEGGGGKERPAGPQVLDDVRVRLEDERAGPFGHLGGEAAARVDGRQDVEAVAETGLEVVLAVAGRAVDHPPSALARDLF